MTSSINSLVTLLSVFFECFNGIFEFYRKTAKVFVQLAYLQHSSYKFFESIFILTPCREINQFLTPMEQQAAVKDIKHIFLIEKRKSGHSLEPKFLRP